MLDTGRSTSFMPLADPMDFKTEALRQIALHRARSRAFGEDTALFANPAWLILLDLMAHKQGDPRTSIGGCCTASGVPTTTAIRWINRLIDKGFLDRTPDEADGRRFLISLTKPARKRMEAWLRIAANIDSIDGTSCCD